MQINVQALTEEELVKPNTASEKESHRIRQLVEETRLRQMDRQGCVNANLSPKDCEIVCALGAREQEFLSKVLQRLQLSARAYHRLLKVARTIADMRRMEQMELSDLQQALSFKQSLQAPK